MTAVPPWLIGTTYTLILISLAMAVWSLLADEDDLLRPAFVSLAGSAVVGSIARVANPFLDADERFRAWCVVAILVIGLCALWEYICQWSLRPFRFLLLVPPAVELGRMAMTIPAHVRSTAEQIVVLLNQLPEPVKNALIVGAVLLTFLAACVKLVKTLAT